MTTLEELGMWYDPGTKCIVTTNTRRELATGVAYDVLYQDEDGFWLFDVGLTNQDSTAEVDVAAERYESLQHSPIPGEIWEVTHTNGTTERAIVTDTGYFRTPTSTYGQQKVTRKTLLLKAD